MGQKEQQAMEKLLGTPGLGKSLVQPPELKEEKEEPRHSRKECSPVPAPWKKQEALSLRALGQPRDWATQQDPTLTTKKP